MHSVLRHSSAGERAIILTKRAQPQDRWQQDHPPAVRDYPTPIDLRIPMSALKSVRRSIMSIRSHHQSVRHQLQDRNRRRPQIHVPHRDVGRPVCVRTAWERRVLDPHLFTEYRLGRYPGRDHHQHHGAKDDIKDVAFFVVRLGVEQDVHRLEIQHHLDACTREKKEVKMGTDVQFLDRTYHTGCSASLSPRIPSSGTRDRWKTWPKTYGKRSRMSTPLIIYIFQG